MASRLSPAEEVFVNIFTTLYGEQHRSYLLKYHNLPFIDTHGSQRFMDFALFLPDKKIAIEIEGEAYHQMMSRMTSRGPGEMDRQTRSPPNTTTKTLNHEAGANRNF
jgi:hypothetical protein